MKSSFILLLAIIVGTGVVAQSKTDWEQLSLKGKVKSLQTKQTHRYKKNGVFTPWENSYSHLTRFNTTGYRTEYNEFLANDSLNYKITYTHTPKERKTELRYFNKELKPTIRKTYLYDAKGNHIDQLEYTTDGQQDRRYTYTYDANGNMLTITGYKKDGAVSSTTTYQYDSKNRRTNYLLETPGYANSFRKFVYDDKGNMTEEFWYNGKGATDFRFVRSYDAQGNKIEETSYKGNGQLVGTTRYAYEYDKKGNWTKKTDFISDGTDFHTETRTITYY